MATVKILPMQWVGDLALQQTGSMEGFFAMAVLNSVNVTDTLTPGAMINDGGAVISAMLVATYQNNGIKPATAIGAGGSSPLAGGIGYWGIGYDFIVS